MKEASFTYIPLENPEGRISGLYFKDRLVLVDPFGKALSHCLKVHPDGWNDCWDVYWTPPKTNWKQKDRAECLRYLCQKWLDRDKQTLYQHVEQKQFELLDNSVKWFIVQELIELTDPLETMFQGVRVKLPVNRTGGFLPYALNMLIVGTIICKRLPEWSNSDQAAEDVTSFLHEDGLLFPLEQLYFDFFNERQFLEFFVDFLHKKYAKCNNIYLQISEYSTDKLTDTQIKDIFEEQLSLYETDKVLLELLPSPAAILLKRLTSSFFRHMYQDVGYLDKEGCLRAKLFDYFENLRNAQGEYWDSEIEQNTTFEDTFTYIYRQTNEYPKLIDFLIKEKCRTDFHADADWARHALVIYNTRPSILQKCPHTFIEWLKLFCHLFGRKFVRNYEPAKLNTDRKSHIECYMPPKTIG